MHIKVHESYRRVIAICDSDLIGKRFEEGKMQLEITESFFKGKEVENEEALELLKDYALDDATFNIVGKESVETAIKSGIISKEGVSEIQGIPFALVLL